MMANDMEKVIGGIWLGYWLWRLACIDRQLGVLPNRWVLLLAVSAVYPLGCGLVDFAAAVQGSVCGGGALWFLRCLSRSGIGWGDVKLTAAMGLWLGWQAMAVALGVAFFLGGIVAGILVLRAAYRPSDKLPFGPFLAMGFFGAYWFGVACWRWYWSLC
ncbi:leader peptidase (prepilin peptidase) / N-methyltransferase [Selenomonas sp. GACV-9]|uniref:prepilin peptidase n=1 Tax=Selenomonas sp. GACV-9 TaxID=3158782 RepID=UPI0008F06E11|nr:leader peptidase (prepilin peptidase) / N-methyltransferase [Selenomonas ruminantium]